MSLRFSLFSKVISSPSFAPLAYLFFPKKLVSRKLVNCSAAMIFASVFALRVAPVNAATNNHKPAVASKKVVAKTSKTSMAARQKYVIAKGGKVRVNGRLVAVRRSEPIRPSQGVLAGLHGTEDPLELKAGVAYVLDLATSDIVFSKNSDVVLPIASITKLMTALVVVEAQLPLDEYIEITNADVDTEKGSHSRLKVGTRLTRADIMHIALMASENRAAHALGRTYPGGLVAFVAAMNAKARLLGMQSTQFVDPTGLRSSNVSSGGDLAKLVAAAYQYDVIRQFSTGTEHWITGVDGQGVRYRNSNALVMNPDWQIDVSKTGYISEAGRCLVMHTRIQDRPFIIVLLDSLAKHTRLDDAGRIKRWLEESIRRLS